MSEPHPHPSPTGRAAAVVTPLVGSFAKAELTSQERELWNPWTSGDRVGTAADEHRFVAELRELVAASGPAQPRAAAAHHRIEVTAVVTALRGGVAVAAMLERAPGLKPAALLAAYDDVDDRRGRAELAWRTIVDQPTPESLATYGPTAGQLLPVVISHLGALKLRRAGDREMFAETVRTVDDEISRTVAMVDQLEARLDAGGLAAVHRQQVSDLLYDRFGQGAWSMSTFLSPRVGALIPVRVDALLGA